MITIELIELLSLIVVPMALYVCFVIWFTLKNRKMDVYVKPVVFRWQIKTTLLLIGTTIIIVIFQPAVFLSILGQEIPLINVLGLSAIISPILLTVILFGLVIWPSILILGGLFLFLLTLGFEPARLLFWGYVLATTMVYLSLFSSGKHALDTLVLRVKEVGYFDVASDLEANSGWGALFQGLMLPVGLFIRFLRRATKVGVVKITLSFKPSGMDRTRGRERWIKTSTTVTLERMSDSYDEIQSRIDNLKKLHRF